MLQLAGIAETLQQITALSDKIAPYLDLAESVVNDPALPRVANLARQIRDYGARPPAAPPASSSATATAAVPAKPTGSFKLAKLEKVLEAYLYTKKHPWVVYAGATGMILLPIGIGLGIGRLSKQCKR